MSQNQATLAELQAAYKEIMKAAEDVCREKYPHLNIVPGSMVQEEDHPKFAAKRRVKVVCGCGTVVERATSDLFTFMGCGVCKKDVKKARKALKKGTTTGLLAQIERLKAQIAANTIEANGTNAVAILDTEGVEVTVSQAPAEPAMVTTGPQEAEAEATPEVTAQPTETTTEAAPEATPEVEVTAQPVAEPALPETISHSGKKGRKKS